jgi:hypothetical protein
MWAKDTGKREVLPTMWRQTVEHSALAERAEQT